MNIVQAAREPEPKVPGDLQALVDDAQAAIEALLATSPGEDVQRGREIVAIIRSKEQATDIDSTAGAAAQQEAKRLEGLL